MRQRKAPPALCVLHKEHAEREQRFQLELRAEHGRADKGGQADRQHDEGHSEGIDHDRLPFCSGVKKPDLSTLGSMPLAA